MQTLCTCFVRIAAFMPLLNVYRPRVKTLHCLSFNSDLFTVFWKYFVNTKCFYRAGCPVNSALHIARVCFCLSHSLVQSYCLRLLECHS